MYRYNVDDVMEEKNLTKIIENFKGEEIPRFELLEKYYRVKNDILLRTSKDGKPNNKLAHGFAKYITKMATGYFMGKGVRYHIGDEKLQDYKKLLSDILDNNYTNSSNFEICKEASKKGVAFELLYIDEKGRLKTKKLNAEEVIPIYSLDIGEFLECAIRIWSEKAIGDSDVTEYAALYTETEILTYCKKNTANNYTLLDIEKHMLEDIPVIVYWNNEECTGDYEDIISLVDAYDKAQSDTANDSEYFADAYLWISGAAGGLKMTMDRGRTFQLDAMDVNETNFIASAGNVLGEFQRMHVVPEIDAYRYSKIAAYAIANSRLTSGYTPAAGSILGKIRENLYEIWDEVGDGIELVISISTKVAQILDSSADIQKMLGVSDFKKGDVSLKVRTIDDVPLIKVPSTRMKTKYLFKDGGGAQKEGGFEAASDAQEINWLITERKIPMAISKTDKVRIFAPDINQKADAWKIDFRKYHDLWITSNKINGVWANVK